MLRYSLRHLVGSQTCFWIDRKWGNNQISGSARLYLLWLPGFWIFERLPKAPISIHALYFKWSFTAAPIITYKYTWTTVRIQSLFCSLSVPCSRPEREVERTRSYFHKDSMPLTLNVLKMAPLRSGLASWVQIRYRSIGLGTPIRPAALFISNTITQRHKVTLVCPEIWTGT